MSDRKFRVPIDFYSDALDPVTTLDRVLVIIETVCGKSHTEMPVEFSSSLGIVLLTFPLDNQEEIDCLKITLNGMYEVTA